MANRLPLGRGRYPASRFEKITRKNNGRQIAAPTFKVKTQQAKREGFDKTRVQGNLDATDEYPGCPYCGTHGFVQCGQCQKITCWNGETSMVCKWCGHKMERIVTTTEKFSVVGDKF